MAAVTGAATVGGSGGGIDVDVDILLVHIHRIPTTLT